MSVVVRQKNNLNHFATNQCVVDTHDNAQETENVLLVGLC